MRHLATVQQTRQVATQRPPAKLSSDNFVIRTALLLQWWNPRAMQPRRPHHPRSEAMRTMPNYSQPTPRNFAQLLAFAVAAVVAACGGSSPGVSTASGPAVGADTLPGAQFSSDTGPADGTNKGLPDSVGGDTASDGSTPSGDSDGSSGNQSGSCEFPVSPGPGEPGALCESATDCDSGWCVTGPSGKVCTKTCSSCCPSGYACEATVGASGDNAYVCLPKQNALCRPCLADAECAAVSPGALCVSYGNAGHFCGGTCATDANCFAGHSCQQVDGTTGAGKQCVKTQGECSCTEAAINAGASTTCQATGEAGTCSGTRKCTAKGLSACSATTPTTESCNGLDDDCDGKTDEDGAIGCKNYWFDGDGDGAGLPSAVAQCACAMPAGVTGTSNTDCNDSDPSIHSAATEVCNGKDDDCDGITDFGTTSDIDGDGLVDCIDPDIDGDGIANAGDCSPTNASVFPGAAETCNGIDDDCDGTPDQPGTAGCQPFYNDADQDGFGFGTVQCLCQATGSITSLNNKDCDDSTAQISPSAGEQCGNAKDDDCNGQIDEEGAAGCKLYYTDPDGDGYGAADHACLCGKQGTYQVELGGDCAPGDPAISPGAVEVCNGKDDDCKGGTDESGADGCTTYFADSDGDGAGVGASTQCLCSPAGSFTALTGGDCDDSKASVKPGASEVCDNLDNNCNGKTDEPGAVGCQTWYIDKDGDSFGVVGSGSCLCEPFVPYSTQKGGDCNDGNNQVSPGANEFCDGIDNDCDGVTDEDGATGCSKYLLDEDKDGYGVTGSVKCLCKEAFPYTASLGGDCNDASASANPAAAEVCDTLDNNCDGLTDPAGASGCSTFYFDGDTDGYGTALAAPKCLCGPSDSYTTAVAGDCKDADKAIYPGAAEVCDGKDDNCDGSVDPAGTTGCANYFADGDSDDYGSSVLSQCLCAAKAPFTATKGGDCNDQAAGIHPGASEVCNTVDDDCNGKTDETGGTAQYYMDADGDGYGIGSPITACGPVSPFTATKAGDCNDSDNTAHPGATEVQCNSKDEDCNGSDLCNTCQPTVLESFDSGAPGWTLGPGWGLLSWAGKGGGLGLAYGDGVSSYPTSTSAAVTSKNLLIPYGTTNLQFYYYYTPDPSEYGTYDVLSIQINGQEMVNRTAGDGKAKGWVQFTATGVPASWWGTTIPFAVSAQTKDGGLNNGPGMAVDAITALCN